MLKNINIIPWRSIEPAEPWKRVAAFIIDIAIMIPPVLFVAAIHNNKPFSGVSLFYWMLCSLWAMYTVFFGIGLPLYKGVIGIGDTLMKIGVTDLEGRRIGRFKLALRQLLFCFLLLWMLLPSFYIAAIIVNFVLLASMFNKDKKYNAYMNSIDKLFKTKVMSIEYVKDLNN